MPFLNMVTYLFFESKLRIHSQFWERKSCFYFLYMSFSVVTYIYIYIYIEERSGCARHMLGMEYFIKGT